jgi:hypothetical protein
MIEMYSFFEILNNYWNQLLIPSKNFLNFLAVKKYSNVKGL